MYQRTLVPLDSLPAAVLIIIFEFAILLASFGAIRLQGSKRSLPLLNDPVIASRVAEISERMRVNPPCIRLLGSLSGSLDAYAAAGCIPTPTIVVSDGVLHRLSDSERDAIIAHELAHLATGSLWAYVLIVCVAAAGAVLSISMVSAFAAIPIALCLFVGLRRIVSRPIELICDRRAGEAVGFETMIESLSKVHAAHPIRADTLAGFLVYATTTHPHPDVRVAALRSRVGSLHGGIRDADRRLLFKHRLGGAIAFVIWLIALVCAHVAGRNARLQWFVWSLCIAVALAPTAFVLTAVGRQRRLGRQRTGSRWSLLGWLVVLIMIGVFAFLIQRSNTWSRLELSDESTIYSTLISITVPVIAISVLVTVWINNRGRTLRVEVESALRERDPARALLAAESKRKLVRRDPLLRLNLSVARILSGDRAAAIREAEQLAQDFPRFHAAKFNLASFVLDVDSERSLRIAQQLAESLPKDPLPAIYAARALRRLDRLVEAEQCTRQSIRLDPYNGVARAVAAGIKIAQGETDAARQLITEAQSLAPGDVFVKMAQAELALSCEPVEIAQKAVDTAAVAVHANPFALLDQELCTLRERLNERAGSPVPVLLFPPH